MSKVSNKHLPLTSVEYLYTFNRIPMLDYKNNTLCIKVRQVHKTLTELMYVNATIGQVIQLDDIQPVELPLRDKAKMSQVFEIVRALVAFPYELNLFRVHIFNMSVAGISILELYKLILQITVFLC